MKIRRFLCLARRAYEADRAYYRGLIVRAIEDFVVLYIMFAFTWGIAHLASGILALMGAAA